MKKVIAMVLTLCMVFALCATASAEEEKPILGYAQLETTTAWRQAQLNSMKESAEAAGFEFIYTDAQSDPSKQVSDVEDLIVQGADYIVISPANDKGYDAVLADCKAEGIPVIIIDRELAMAPGENYVCYIGADFYNEGKCIGEWMVEEFDGACNIVEIQGTPGSCATGRSEGFYSVIEEYPDMVLLSGQNGNWTRADAQIVMENIIQAHGDDIDVVYSHSDEMLYGILIALENAGYKPGEDVKVCSVDGTVTMVQKIVDGEVSADYLCSPFFGPAVMEVVDKLANGETVDTNILNPGFMFTADNAADNMDKAC